ncbi:MAG: DNA repair protein RecO [Alphaproteobacteria bacterium]|nr:DNA repair protein RecO [Alphaproteobacteria bacterium]
MKIESTGILMSLRPFGERDCVAHIFSRDYGLLSGIMRGAQIARKNRPLVGQTGVVSWNARLNSQLGVFHWDADKNLMAPIMISRQCLMFANCAFDLIVTLLPERVAYTDLYNQTNVLLNDLVNKDATSVYLNWEISLLRELGYALDLSHCSGCGGHDDLRYLSPRTGRAVCGKCGMPYIGRLYDLPLNLTITEKFIDGACADQETHIPVSRKILATIIS